MRTKAPAYLGVNLLLVVVLSAVLAVTAHALTISGNKVDMESENESSEIELRVSSDAGNTPLLHGTNAGGTLAIPTYTPNNRTLLSVGGQGHDGSTWTNGSSANIRFRSTENWSPAGHGSEIRFGTTQNGSIVNTERMRITNDGKIGIGTSSPTQALDVAGNVNTSGTVTATTFTGSGSGLTNLDPANIASGTANVNISGNAATATTATAATTANAVATGSVSTDGLSSGAVTPVKIAFFGNVAIVAPSGGDYTDPATAMSDYASWCGTPSATNPCLLKIMPGVYNTGSSSVVMQPFIDIEGSGENATKLKGNLNSWNLGVVTGASDSEIRFLTVENTGGGTDSVAIRSGIYNASVGPFRITHVTASASGGTWQNYGIVNLGYAPVRMISVTASASGGSNSTGILHSGNPVTMIDVTASATGGTSNYGIMNELNSAPTLKNIRASASGGTYNYGIFSYSSSSVMTGVEAFGDTYGVYITSSSETPSTTKINHSVIRGTYYALGYGQYSTVYVGSTQLDGGAFDDGGTLTCAGVYNGNYIFYASTCP